MPGIEPEGPSVELSREMESEVEKHYQATFKEKQMRMKLNG